MSQGDPVDLTFGTPTVEVEKGSPEDDPVEASEEMAEAAEEEPSTPVDEPQEDCVKPWLEITAFSEAGEPLAGAPYKVDLPSVQAEGTLDDQGFVHIDGVTESPSQVCVKILQDDSGSTPTYKVEVVPKEAQETTEKETTLDPRLDIMWPPWEPF